MAATTVQQVQKTGSVTLSTPTIEIPDILDKKTDEILIPENVPKFIEFVAKLPTLPSQILKIVPGEIPIEKWMKRLNAMVAEAQKIIKEYAEKQAKLIKQKARLQKKLLQDGTTNAMRKVIEKQMAEIDKELGLVADIMNLFQSIAEYVKEVYNKIKQLMEKVIKWVIEKVMNLVNIPPHIKFWVKIFGGILFKFAKGEISLPGADPSAIVSWLQDNVVAPIKDLATINFKPPIRALQCVIDEINSVTKHPHSCTWTFTYWSDMPTEMLKSDSVMKMIPDKLKPTVKQIIAAAEKVDTADEKAKANMKKV